MEYLGSFLPSSRSVRTLMQGISNSDFVQVTNPSLMQYFCEVVSECALSVECVNFKGNLILC